MTSSPWLRLVFVALFSIQIVTTFAADPVADRGSVSSSARMNSLPKSLQVFPEQLDFQYGDDVQQVVVTVRFADGSTREVTSDVDWELSTPAMLKNDPEHPGRFAPNASFTESEDERGELVVRWKDLTASIPVDTSLRSEERPLTFRNDVLAVLTRAGCNTGKCHGAASGKDGFGLSLFGYDPQGDHYRITKELSGRRVNLGDPLNSLLLGKATGEVPHTGGRKIEPGSPHFRTLVMWLAQGAQPDPSSTALPTGIQVHPSSAVLSEPGHQQRLVVMAHYSDGSVRDVTEFSVFLSNNDAAASISEDGLASGTGPGTAFIMARFDQFTAGTSIVVRPGKKYPEASFQPANYIDELTLERWQDLHLLPSEVCSDEVFLRRVSLDLTGLLPSEELRSQFLNDPAEDKRSRLVEKLVESNEFLDLWVLKLAEMLQIRRENGLSSKSLNLYDAWLRDQVHRGETVDSIVRQVISANGGTFDNPATSYFQTETTAQLLAENIAQAFLGMRIQCAQCHNHPFDRWTMDDYYGFAGFVSQVGYKQARDPREITIFNAGEGQLEHPVKGREVRLKFLGGEYAQPEEGQDYRAVLAEWLTDKNNTDFARHIANVWWAHFNGVGIVEPVDDVRVSNPPSNPALWKELGDRLIDYEFDVRKLARDICCSKTYQLATTKNDWNQWDLRDFSHAQVRRLRAEVLLDCINQVTETSDRLAGLPLGGRAVQVPGAESSSYFLETFGRASRDTPCSCEVSTAPTLSQALHLLNGETTSGKIEQGQMIKRWMSQGLSRDEMVRKIYIRCLTREPTSKERSSINQRLSTATDVPAELVDLFWALLNSNEFIFNH